MLILSLICIFVSIAIFVYEGYHTFKKSYAAYEQRYIERAAGVLDEMFVFLPPEKILFLTFVSTFLGALSGFVLSMKAPFWVVLIITAIFGGIGYLTPKFVLRSMLIKRVEKFNEQLVDCLSNVANGLKAGFSFIQAIDAVVKEMSAPISQEFELLLRENKMGVPLEQALLNLTGRVKSEDLDLVVTSVITVKQVGGNLAEIFDRIADTIRERNKLQGKIKALTAQGKMQGIIVGLLPLLLGAAMYKINPELMKPLFTEPLGWAAIGLIVFLEGIGAFLIKKIVTIDI